MTQSNDPPLTDADLEAIEARAVWLHHVERSLIAWDLQRLLAEARRLRVEMGMLREEYVRRIAELEQQGHQMRLEYTNRLAELEQERDAATHEARYPSN